MDNLQAACKYLFLVGIGAVLGIAAQEHGAKAKKPTVDECATVCPTPAPEKTATDLANDAEFDIAPLRESIERPLGVKP